MNQIHDSFSSLLQVNLGFCKYSIDMLSIGPLNYHQNASLVVALGHLLTKSKYIIIQQSK